MLLEASNLSYRKGKFSLHLERFSVNQGEIVGIGGPNGSGKSTLIRLLTGIAKPESGTIKFNGVDTRSLSRIQIARNISLMSQEIPMPFALSVNDILLTASYSNPGGEKDIGEVLEICGIPGLRYRDFSTLSGGEKRMAMLAATIVQDAGILMMDEPGTFLDPDRENTLFKIISQMKEKGKAIVFVLHDISALHKYSDKVCLMKSGECVAYGPKGEVVNEENLKKVFGLKFSSYDSPEGKRFAYSF